MRSDRNSQILSDVRAALLEIQQSPKHAPVITVDSIKRIDKGALRAFVSVTINQKLTIHSCRVIHQDEQSPWVSVPQREVPDPDGGRSKYFPIIEIHDKNLKQAIERAVLDEYRKAAQ